MKTLRILSILMFIALSAGFTSCSDDDDSDISEANLAGTWEATYSEGFYKDSERPNEKDEWNGPLLGQDKYQATFNANGTGIDGDGDSFTWTLKGDVLTTVYDDEDAMIGKILKLTDKELITVSSEKGDTWEMYNKDTFKRIK